MAYRLGVDLGTTFCSAAIAHDRGVDRADRWSLIEAVTFGHGDPTIPSVVFLGTDGQVLVGRPAERRAAAEPRRVAREFKRQLGSGTPLLVGDQRVQPETLMAHMLAHVLEQVVEEQGEPPTFLVLTHPANWEDHKLELVRKAVEPIAQGIDYAFLSEPEAAAYYYASSERIDPGQSVAVYDLGGGTFDATVLRHTEGGTFEFLGEPDGIEYLGGIDFDALVYEFVEEHLADALEALDDSAPSRNALAELRQKCVEAKIALSTDVDTAIVVNLPSLNTELQLTRTEFEDMIRPSVRDTVDTLVETIEQAGLTVDEVSRILLVGGSSRIPLVGDMLRRELGIDVAVDAHAKLSIARGAAHHATTIVLASDAEALAAIDQEHAAAALVAEQDASAREQEDERQRQERAAAEQRAAEAEARAREAEERAASEQQRREAEERARREAEERARKEREKRQAQARPARKRKTFVGVIAAVLVAATGIAGAAIFGGDPDPKLGTTTSGPSTSTRPTTTTLAKGTVPVVVGLDQRKARQALGLAGYDAIEVQTETNTGLWQPGEVVRVRPQEGTATKPGADVTLWIAGPMPVTTTIATTPPTDPPDSNPDPSPDTNPPVTSPPDNGGPSCQELGTC